MYFLQRSVVFLRASWGGGTGDEAASNQIGTQIQAAGAGGQDHEGLEGVRSMRSQRERVGMLLI